MLAKWVRARLGRARWAVAIYLVLDALAAVAIAASWL